MSVGLNDDGAGDSGLDGEFGVVAEEYDAWEPLEDLDDRPGRHAEGRQPIGTAGVVAHDSQDAATGSRLQTGEVPRLLRR